MEQTLSHRKVLDLIINIGYLILKSGGEINRVEDTVNRIALAYGMDYVHTFAIGSSLVVTTEKDGVSLTQTRRVKSISTNLNRVEKLNSLSREICEAPASYEEVMDRIHKIEKGPRYPEWINVLAFGIVGGGFSVFFGGGLKEFILGIITGAILRLVMMLFTFFQSPPFILNVIGASTTVIAVKVFSLIYPAFDADYVTIGVLMNLVPGVLLTNCIRDFLATDYVAGTSKIIEAFFTATAIALGVAVSVLWR